MPKNSSAKYYQNNKERQQEKALERYQSLSKEEQEKKPQYGHERHKILDNSVIEKLKYRS